MFMNVLAEGRLDLVRWRRSVRGIREGNSREASRGARRLRAATADRRASRRRRARRRPSNSRRELATPDVLAGPHGDAVRRAAADRAMMLGIVERAAAGRARDDSRHRPDGRRAGAARRRRWRRRCTGSTPTSPARRSAASTQRIAGAARPSRTTPERERRLSLLQRQRISLHELLERRRSLANQLESAGLMLQNLKLDLLKFRSSGVGSAIEDTTSATQEARAPVARASATLVEAARRPEETSRRDAASCDVQRARSQAVAIASATWRGDSSGVKWRPPAIDVERRAGNRLLQPLRRPRAESRGPAGPTRLPSARRCRASWPPSSRVSSVVERADVRDERVATVGAGERPQVEIDRPRGADADHRSRVRDRGGESRASSRGGRKRVIGSVARAMRLRSSASDRTRRCRRDRATTRARAWRMASDCAMPPPMP